MSRRNSLLLGVVAVLLAGAVRPSAQDAAELSSPGAPQVKQQLVGAGKWQSRRSGDDAQGWHIQLKRLDDDSLAGRITVVGSPSIRQARIEGQISGTDVYGVLVGDDDIQVGTFTGSILKGGPSTGLRTGFETSPKEGERKNADHSESNDSQTVRAEALEARSSHLSTLSTEGSEVLKSIAALRSVKQRRISVLRVRLRRG